MGKEVVYDAVVSATEQAIERVRSYSSGSQQSSSSEGAKQQSQGQGQQAKSAER